MEFKNITEEAVKVRFDDGDNKGKAASECKWTWKTIYPGGIVDIPKEYGKNLGFLSMEKEEVELEVGVEVLAEPDPDIVRAVEMPNAEAVFGSGKIEAKYLSKLLDIQGIGPKIAQDTVAAYPTEAALKKAIKNKGHISARDDIVVSLKKAFG